MEEFIRKSEARRAVLKAYPAAAYCIDSIKPVNVREVVCANWVWKDGKCFCSACHEQGEAKRVYQDGTVDEYSFCPNCGAKQMED